MPKYRRPYIRWEGCHPTFLAHPRRLAKKAEVPFVIYDSYPGSTCLPIKMTGSGWSILARQQGEAPNGAQDNIKPQAPPKTLRNNRAQASYCGIAIEWVETNVSRVVGFTDRRPAGTARNNTILDLSTTILHLLGLPYAYILHA